MEIVGMIVVFGFFRVYLLTNKTEHNKYYELDRKLHHVCDGVL